jgi:hypothetical protein
MLHFQFGCVLTCLAIGSTTSLAGDLSKVERSIVKEPAYRSKTPTYGLLAFGPKAGHRVWLVLDGDKLYVDRNGNGDLTEPGEKVAADKTRDPAEYGYSFEVGDLSVGGKVHKGLSVHVLPLSLHVPNPSFERFAPLHAALKADPKATAASLSIDVESSRLKGGGANGRLSYRVGFFDVNGLLQFQNRPTEAPIIHFDGPMQITFFGPPPRLRIGRQEDVVLMIGTPGRGPGTFATLAYEETVPKEAHPQIEVAWPAGKPDNSPVRERYELKERC